MRHNKKGFSLIELMVTIAILGVLSAIAIPSYMGVSKKSKRSEFKTNLEVLRLLEERYYAERGEYVEALDTALLKTTFSEFKPGDEADLEYTYSVTVPSGGQTFTASATGKTGSHDDGMVFSMDQDNSRVGW